MARGKDSKETATHVANRDIRPGSVGKAKVKEVDTGRQEARAACEPWMTIGQAFSP